MIMYNRMSQRINDVLRILKGARNILQRLRIEGVNIDSIETKRLGQHESCREARGGYDGVQGVVAEDSEDIGAGGRRAGRDIEGVVVW